MNLRPLQFYSNLMDITQVKKVVNMAKSIPTSIRNNTECKRLSSGRANCCHLSSWPELSHECRAHTPVRTLTHIWSETTGFPGKQTQVQTRSGSHTAFSLLGRMGTSSPNSSPAARDSTKAATKCLLCFKYTGEQSPTCQSVLSWLNDCIVLCSAFRDYSQISAGSKCSRQLPALSSAYLRRHAAHCIAQTAPALRSL